MSKTQYKTVAILGAGPVGLAAAAHVIERGMVPLVLEQGPEVGHAMKQWGHVQLFSHWGLNVDAAARRLLQAHGWQLPDEDGFPAGAEIVDRYLVPLSRLPGLEGRVHCNHRVISLSRLGLDKVVDQDRAATPFLILVQSPDGERRFIADAVIDATGTWFSPNPAGSGGLPATGELGHPALRYGMPDVSGAERARYLGKRVAVLGGGHSAVGTLIELANLPDTTPIWLLRKNSPRRALGGGAADQLAERGTLGMVLTRIIGDERVKVQSGFHLAEIDGTPPILRAEDGRQVLADQLVVATGFRPDLSFLREVRVSLDAGLECPPALAPLIDPNLHSCGTVRPHGAAELAHPEPGFYIAGMKSYGRAPTFLMATGYEQVRSIVAQIAGDQAAAARVELVLPETGICNGPPVTAQASCCGGAPIARTDACCAQDEAAKNAGGPGCGCNSPAPPETVRCCG
ncbi:FAD-dependent oxidoreductase [Paracoccus sp. SY]|uniref:FAD-dependent oxidoreductase n=1 Tax=Paracoccus sp. SY TaxID=1330255 RepID=UPI000CD19651|nr:FAD-dependent oxidoreductase [Paracoccus sp. SY]